MQGTEVREINDPCDYMEMLDMDGPTLNPINYAPPTPELHTNESSFNIAMVMKGVPRSYGSVWLAIYNQNGQY